MTVVEALQRFKAGDLTEDAIFRAILEHPDWCVPVNEASHPGLWNLGGEDFVAAMVDEHSPDGGPCEWMHVSGRHLVRSLPDDAKGVVFELSRPHALVMPQVPAGPVMRQWAGAVDVEEAMRHPGPAQADRFLGHDWLWLCRADGPAIAVSDSLHVVHVFTASDALRRFLDLEPSLRALEVRKVRGSTLFAELSTRSDWDGVVVNPRRDGWEPLSPAFAAAILDHQDVRSDARTLPARTVAELHLFLDLEGVSPTDRSHALVYRGDLLVARYEGAVRGGARAVYWFAPVEPTDDPSELGEGASAILCAGALADALRRRLAFLPGDPAAVAKDDRALAAVAARWAFELEKMLPEGGGSIPRSCLRSARGARWAREAPELLTREWIGQSRRLAEALAGTN